MNGQRVGRLWAAATLLAASGLLAGCSSSDDSGSNDAKGGSSSEPAAPDSSSSESPSGSDSSATTPPGPYLPVPDGVQLSPQGSQLKVGDTATVAYEVRQGVVGVLDIKVIRLEKTTFKKSFAGWDLDQGQKNANPYFVRVVVTNRGDTDLGGRRVPLYIVDGENTLVEATTFASSFPPCQPGEFPKKFKTGQKLRGCLVFLSPRQGPLTAVSFRPTQDFDPITWTGPMEKPEKTKPHKGGGKSGKSGESSGQADRSGQRGGKAKPGKSGTAGG